MHFRLFTLFIFVFLKTSFAQDIKTSVKSDTLIITLADAEKIMINQNLILLARQYEISAAKALVIQAKLWDNPTLYVETNPWNGQTGKFFSYYPSNRLDANGRIAGNETLGAIDQVIKTAGKRSNLVKLNRINAEIAEYVFYDVLRSLKFTLREDFSLLIQFQQAIKLLNEEIEAADRLVNITQEQLLKGNFAEKDLIRLQALEFSLQMTKRDYLKQMVDTQAEMKTLLGTKPNVFIVALRDTSIYSRQLPVLVEPLLETAQEKRSDLKAVEGQYRAAETNVHLQKSLAVPDADVTVNYTRYSNYTIDYIGLGLRVNLPLLNHNQGNIRNAKELLNAQQLVYSNMQKQVSNEVAAAFYELQNSKNAYEGFDRPFIGKFDTYFKKLLINFQRRVIGLVEFIDFFETYRDTKLSSFNLEQDYFNAMEQLNFRVGTEVINTK